MQTEKQLTFNIEFDGNDGTGKTYVINLIKQFFNNCIFKDRGIFSKATLLNKESEEKMYDYIDNNIDNDTLYIILDDFPEHCQQRIQKRGDSLDEEFHTLEDKNDKENNVFNFIEQQKASTNNNARSGSARTTDEQTKIVATSTIASDKSADLVDAANSMLCNINDTLLYTDDTSWVYAELGDYLDEVVQTSIELSQPSGEPPLDDATKQQMATDANRYMAQDGANGANGANAQNA